MFTGIVQAYLPIKKIEHQTGLMSFAVEFPLDLLVDLKIGASVALDGVCLTVVRIDGHDVSFDAMMETLRLTTLQYLKEGQKINVERSARLSDEVGGHRVSGHVSTLAEIVSVQEPENNKVVTFEVSPDELKYIFQKGFIALDGCSLTVTNVDAKKGTFDVWLIPETLARTGFGKKTVGDKVNVEFDPTTQVIVDTVERIMKQQS